MPAALRFEPHIVVLMLGTNDAKRHLWRSGPCSEPRHNMSHGLSQIVETFLNASRPPQLLMLLPPPPMLAEHKFGIEASLLVQARRVVADVATAVRQRQQQRQHLHGATTAAVVVPSTQVLLAPALPIPRHQDVFIFDGLHLNANGTALMACAIHHALRRSSMLRCAKRDKARDKGSVGRLRSCWPPFCKTATGGQPADDGHLRRCDEESGIAAPYMLTGMACSGLSASDHSRERSLTAAARATCDALRRTHGGWEPHHPFNAAWLEDQLERSQVTAARRSAADQTPAPRTAPLAAAAASRARVEVRVRRRSSPPPAGTSRDDAEYADEAAMETANVQVHAPFSLLWLLQLLLASVVSPVMALAAAGLCLSATGRYGYAWQQRKRNEGGMRFLRSLDE